MASPITKQLLPKFESTKLNYWYPGHMAKTQRLLQDKFYRIADVLIEVRDSRLPLSSINSKFERSATKWSTKTGKMRLIVYNKMDMVSENDFTAIKSRFAPRYPEDSLLMVSSKNDKSIKSIIDVLKSHLNKGYVTAVVVGMPNVGKSSVINALRRVGVRKGKVASVAPTPGHTRAFGSRLTIFNDSILKIYLFDSPGIMDPEMKDPITSLKLALVNSTKDSLFPKETIAEYLLHQMNCRRLFGISEQMTAVHELYKLPKSMDSVHELAPYIAKRYSFLKAGGILDTERAVSRFIEDYRNLKFGKWSLDDLDSI